MMVFIVFVTLNEHIRLIDIFILVRSLLAVPYLDGICKNLINYNSNKINKILKE